MNHSKGDSDEEEEKNKPTNTHTHTSLTQNCNLWTVIAKCLPLMLSQVSSYHFKYEGMYVDNWSSKFSLWN